MRVQPRVLAVVPLFAALVVCVGASAGLSGPAQSSCGAPGSLARQFDRTAIPTTAA